MNIRPFQIVILILALTLFSCKKEEIGIDPIKEAPEGELVSHTDCKNNVERILAAPETCLQYEYSNGVLNVNHIDAALNCCPIGFQGVVYIKDNEIVIDQSDINGDCFCMCLYDLSYRIKNLEPGTYTIRVIENIEHPKFEELKIIADLTKDKTGYTCKERVLYPWI